MKVRELVERFEQYAPKQIAEPNDPVGLQIGSLDAEIHNVMTTLDVRPEVVQEAIDNNIDFIFAHHPVMFRPAKNLDLSNPQNKMYADLIQHHITVYAAHTNLDSANNGLNDWLAEALQLVDTTGLVPGYTEAIYSLTVQAPKIYANAVQMSLVDAGAEITADGSRGYTFQWGGLIQYVTSLGVQPGASAVETPAEQDNTRIEFEVSEGHLTDVLKALYDVHLLDQPIYHLVKLDDHRLQYSMGRIGKLRQSMTVKELAELCKKTFKVNGLRVVANELDRSVQTVAILGGDGGKFYHIAKQKGADVYITGDVYYHTGHDMLASDLPVIDPGHYIESICKSKLAQLIKQWASENDWSLQVAESKINTDPFTFI